MSGDSANVQEDSERSHWATGGIIEPDPEREAAFLIHLAMQPCPILIPRGISGSGLVR